MFLGTPTLELVNECLWADSCQPTVVGLGISAIFDRVLYRSDFLSPHEVRCRAGDRSRGEKRSDAVNCRGAECCSPAEPDVHHELAGVVADDLHTGRFSADAVRDDCRHDQFVRPPTE